MNTLVKSFLITFIVANNVFALTHLLSTISNDEDKNTYTISIVTDEDNIEVLNIVKKELDSKKKELSSAAFGVASLERGVVLVERSGHDIVKLKATNLNSSDSADLKMTTTVSALSNTTKDYDLKVDKIGADWRLYLNNKDASKLHFVTNKKIIIGAVGIKDVQTK